MKKDIEEVNAAKRHLLELESVEKTARKLENTVENDAHFTNRLSVYLIIGEIIIILATIGEICYYIARKAPLSTTDFLSLLTTIGIAGFLIWRLDGWQRTKKNEKKLRDLEKQIETEQLEAEKFIN